MASNFMNSLSKTINGINATAKDTQQMVHDFQGEFKSAIDGMTEEQKREAEKQLDGKSVEDFISDQLNELKDIQNLASKFKL